MPTSVPSVVHNEAASRFEISLDGDIARADYRRAGDVLRMVHTEVPPRFEGRGYAGALVKAAFDYARDHGLRIEPACSYVVAYVQRHPETHDLVVGATRR
jgi:predicted GNAT family acetyltransferase